ncbi:histidine kinase/DNA gyrase B/HSP90-like ATPase [Thermosporothrix hazakensis]|jgi:signal transduction histidine kinase|uniref:histidine kinase n=1 Tax=Thermosporothrix hazakensis TaxID=644383 RepID=A0A326U642_THEHA|nr:ATP-binding protein [Thermosporothrix hazakensis]PZW27438.1 histidine kinase/DNA gyrase B/HSP90-like ATPase [Thermosporothrix hazakensis]
MEYPSGKRASFGQLSVTLLSLFRALVVWLRTHTASPPWLPAVFQRPQSACCIALGVTAGSYCLLSLFFPDFSLLSLLLFLLPPGGTLFLWGTGPALLAIVTGEITLFLCFTCLFRPEAFYQLAESTTLLLLLGGIALAQSEAERQQLAQKIQPAHTDETQTPDEDTLTMISHRLRSLLTSLSLNTQVLQESLQAPPSTRTLRLLQQRCTRSLAHISALTLTLDNLVETIRIQTGQLTYDFTECDLTELLRSLLEEQSRLHPDHHFLLSLEPECDQLPLFIDEARISLVVLNLLSNALRFAPADQPITLSLHRVETDQVHVQVHDEGPGLPGFEQERIWERFYCSEYIQAPPGFSHGLGLGLYVTRVIIEGHGGQVGVESTPGKGATFWFQLPLHAL